MFAQSRNFYENKMVSLDPAKSGAWIDGYDYHSKEKKLITFTKR